MLQELHADSPHGPWAFVFSLTDWEHRAFTGGETAIFKPHMLDFWSSFDPARGFEYKDMVGHPAHTLCLYTSPLLQQICGKYCTRGNFTIQAPTPTQNIWVQKEHVESVFHASCRCLWYNNSSTG